MNHWLLGVAFVLGLVLTFALTIRRVKREVPVRSSSVPAGAAAAAAPAKSPSEAETTKIKRPRITRMVRVQLEQRPTAAVRRVGW